MRFNIEEIIKKALRKYSTKNIKISGKDYPLYLVPELSDEDLNIFEGFLFVSTKDRSEVSYLKSRYRPPVSGYAPRLGLILYDDHLLIKDYRRNKHIIKTLNKMNKTFLNKLKKALTVPEEENFRKLFDRTDIIEEFYVLYKKSREYLLKNIKGIPDEEKREEFIDNFMMQMLTLWYLQERGFFNHDNSYFITKFKELRQKKLFNGFKSYYEFLVYFFEKIGNNLDNQYYEDKIVGKVVVIGPAVFLNGEYIKAVSIPDKCFYRDGMTEILINTPPKKVSNEVPLLNLFESRDWTEGNLDEFVLGAIYEKLITYMERKKLGAFYTPEEITSYICKNTIEPYLVDRINEKFGKNFESIDQVIENANKETLLYLFNQLREIKILDPAVGSAHFLESAINVLQNIYENVWNKAKELGIKKGLEIIAADEKGKIKTINLLDISDENQFRLYVKFFIILSRNIYGVDINPSALKVAKARLLLTLAKHFDVRKNYFIRFPNVHFNLRVGNSLVGYLKLRKEKARQQLSLDLFMKKEETAYITESIKVVSELKNYLREVTEALNIDSNMIEELEEMNKILSKKKISWNDLKKVLRTKEKLIKIVIASLNSQYARPLNELLNQITNLFNRKLDKKFAEEHNIELKDLQKIKTFHWIFEFPEVLLGNGGFDIIVGNPPYGNTLSSTEKNICRSYASFTGEIASVFVERSIPLNRDNGYFGYIITYAITFSRNLSGTRKMIFENYKECFISTFDRDNCRFFDNMTQSVSIMLCKRKTINANCKFYTSKMFRRMPEIDKIEYQYANEFLLGNTIGSSFYESHRLPKIGSKVNLEILKKVSSVKNTVSNVINNRFNEKIWIRTSGNYWYNAWDKKPYDSSKIKLFLVDKTYKDFIILLVNSSLFYWWFRIYGDGRDMNIDIFKAFPLPARGIIEKMYYLLKNMRELTMNKLFGVFEKERKRFRTNEVKEYLDLIDLIIGRKYYNLNPREIIWLLNTDHEVRGGNKLFSPFYELLIYLDFLNTTKEREFVEFIDKQIIDSLVYELYFKEKFQHDGIETHLLELVEPYLEDISSLDSDEQKLKVINEVIKRIKNDRKVMEYIKRIKSHPWVKVIEGDKYKS